MVKARGLGAVIGCALAIGACSEEPEILAAGICAEPETATGIRGLLEDAADQDFGGEKRFLTDLTQQLSFDLKSPLAIAVDEQIQRVDCEARASLRISPAVEELFEGKEELVADIGYSVQVTADGAERVYRASGYDEMVAKIVAATEALAESEEASANEHKAEPAVSAETEIAAAEKPAPDMRICAALWRERNSIFASAGYCFKSQRAIEVFGERCHPPYGKLDADDQRIVEKLRQQELENNCPKL